MNPLCGVSQLLTATPAGKPASTARSRSSRPARAARSTPHISDPVVGFVFGQQGLMADVTIEGSKYTKLDL